MSPSFADRLLPVLDEVALEFGTPFHIYDEAGYEATCADYRKAFAGTPFQEYFAVKGLPNPRLLKLITKHGFGLDTSSLPELAIAAETGVSGHDICFTSNNTTDAELLAALDAGALITVDDVAILRRLIRLGELPPVVVLRVHPAAAGDTGVDSRLGDAESSKFGIPAEQITEAAAAALAAGAQQVGLHMMLGSGLMSPGPFLRTLDTLLDLGDRIHRHTSTSLHSVNLGGGIGIPYRPGEPAFDLAGLGREAVRRLETWESGAPGRSRPRLHLECGRSVTGPHGVLVTRVLNRMSKARELIGVDAGMSALMRPAMYGAYHHVSVPFPRTEAVEVVDVVGSLCENNDKFATGRELPRADEGDLILVHDTGAHAHSMGFTYNGRLRPQELLLRTDGAVELVRRAETTEDYLATTRVQPQSFSPSCSVPGRQRTA